MTTRIHRTAYCSARWLVTTKPLFTTALLLVLLQAAAHGAPLILPSRILRVTDGDTVTLQDECQTLQKFALQVSMHQSPPCPMANT